MAIGDPAGAHVAVGRPVLLLEPGKAGGLELPAQVTLVMSDETLSLRRGRVARRKGENERRASLEQPSELAKEGACIIDVLEEAAGQRAVEGLVGPRQGLTTVGLGAALVELAFDAIEHGRADVDGGEHDVGADDFERSTYETGPGADVQPVRALAGQRRDHVGNALVRSISAFIDEMTLVKRG